MFGIDVPILTAFVAGLLTFFAPCTFVSLPIFITYITSQTFGNIQQDSKEYKRKVFTGALLYVIGFVLVFTILGAVATSLGTSFRSNRDILEKVGGGLIFIFGLFIIFGEKLGKYNVFAGNKSINIDFSKFGKGYHVPVILGITTAFAWTPCVGPILGGILTLAASTTNVVSRGSFLLFVYALGINIPFLLVALTIGRSKKYISKFARYANTIYKISGVLMILLGILLMLGISDEIFAVFFRIFAKFGYQPM